MATHSETQTYQTRNSETWRAWTNGIGIVIALIGLFWEPIWLGSIGGIISIIGVSGAKATTDKTWGWTGIVVGVIVLVLGLFGWTFAG